jgi:peptidoglycan/xylan/chitin deacetylase (PgdA/CDA1 family)
LIASVVAQLEARAGTALGGDRHAQGDYAPLTGDELGEMDGSGLISVGSHTVTHPILPRCSPDQLEAELTVSRRIIEKLLGHACRLFCYPNGDFDATTQTAVEQAGYAGAVCSRLGFNQRGADVFAITRLGIPGTLPMAEFAALVSGSLFLLNRLRPRASHV